MIEELKFIALLEEMKKTERRTPVLGTSRKENDAEHSWHIATMALFLQNKTPLNIDINNVVKMLLVHDLVEIFAGDTFAYDEQANLDKKERETQAMFKLKTYLSSEMGEMLENLWLEFDDMKTDDSRYANAMDRLAPLFTNIQTGNGGTWKENDVRLAQVLKRAEPIKIALPDIYNYIYEEINKAVDSGYIK